MKILVPVKRVIDAYVNIRVMRDESGVDKKSVKMSMNPFCEIAIEQAVRMKEAGDADEVIAVTIGPQHFQETLRSALAVGADRAIHILHEEDNAELQPLALAKLLKTVAEKEEPRLIIMGKQAIDGDHNQTGQMLAALLDWPQATFTSGLTVRDGGFEAVREVDGGLQTLELSMPAIVTVDLRLNEPRYPKLPDIMKAKKKEIEQMKASEMDVDIAPRYETLRTTEPPARDAGVIVGSVDDLAEKIRGAI